MTRNQVCSNVPWVRIPPSPPLQIKASKYFARKPFSVLFLFLTSFLTSWNLSAVFSSHLTTFSVTPSYMFSCKGGFSRNCRIFPVVRPDGKNRRFFLGVRECICFTFHRHKKAPEALSRGLFVRIIYYLVCHFRIRPIGQSAAPIGLASWIGQY